MANGAVGSLRRILVCAESTEGTTPVSPTWKEIHTTGGSGLSVGFGLVESALIRADQQTPLPSLGNKSIGMNIPFELAYGWLDDLLESLFRASWSTNVLTNGVTRKSFSVEEGFTDIAQYQVGRGMIAHRMNLSLRQGQKVSGAIDLIGLTAGDYGATSAAGSYTAAPEKETFATYLGAFEEGGSAFEAITGLDLAVEGGGAHKHALFSQNPSFNSLGRIRISGSLTSYFKDDALATKFFAGTPTTLEFTLTDPLGNDYTVLLPRVIYTGKSHSVAEDDVPQTFPWMAGVDPVSGKMISITRAPAA